MSHTPGPWFTVFDGMNAYSAEVASHSRRGLKRVLARCARPYEGDAKANAHLIAAAPDLLAALQRYSTECRALEPQPNCCCIGCETRAAIAKAKGTPPSHLNAAGG